MIINNYINVSDNRLLDGLIPVIKIIAEIEHSRDKDIIIDFSRTKFISPLFALSLLIYISKSNRQISLKNVKGYFELIDFHQGGIKSDKIRQTEFLAMLESYAFKTYIPIIDFPANQNTDAKEAVSTIVENIIIRQLNIQHNVANGLKYIVEETLDNISEHSDSERGYIFAQAYPQKGYLDICIADCGITLLGSYKKRPLNEINSDMEAIKAANRGISSKNLPEAENRGFGIKTSKQMLINGLGGQYLIISGSCMYIKTKNLDSFYMMPGNLYWNGTIVALRIPYNSPTFNYINYIE